MHKKKPLVSVIMAVRNGEKCLNESVQSVLDQTFKNFEFIIINDGSLDRTAEILDRFASADSRIKVVSQKNKGLAASLNSGIEMARGAFIARMDADDICAPDRLEIQAKTLMENPDVGLCHGLFSLMDADGRTVLFRKRSGFRFSSLQTRWTLLWRNCVCHPTVMMRRDILENHGLAYDVSARCQDYEFWGRLIEAADFFVIRQPLLFLRKHPDSVSSKYDEDYLSQFSAVVLRNLKKYLDFPISPSDIRAITLLSGQMYLRGKNMKERIDANRALFLINAVTSKFIERHSPDRAAERQIQRAAARQLIRWSHQAWFHNKKAARRFLLAALSRFFGPSGAGK